jgi:hypothetical protein
LNRSAILDVLGSATNAVSLLKSIPRWRFSASEVAPERGDLEAAVAPCPPRPQSP